MAMGRSTGPATIASGVSAPRVATLDGPLTKIVMRSLNVVSGSDEAAGAAVARLCNASGTAEDVCATPDTIPWASPAGALTAWLTAAA